MSRRTFLTLAWWGAAGLLTIQGTAAAVASLWPKLKGGSFGSKITAGKVNDFPFPSVTYFPQGRFYISHVRTSSGKTGIMAFYRKCVHLGCVVPWKPDEEIMEPPELKISDKGRFNCPCHGSRYDRYGVRRAGPAPRPLDRFPIAINDGEVIVDTGTILLRYKFTDDQVTLV